MADKLNDFLLALTGVALGLMIVLLIGFVGTLLLGMWGIGPIAPMFHPHVGVSMARAWA
jgi:hypothetical protein